MKKLIIILFVLSCILIQNINCQVIYVENYPNGNDTIADGSIYNPFHTLLGALSIIEKDLNREVTIKFGVGEWDFGLKEASALSDFKLTGFDLFIKGTYDTIIDNVYFNYMNDSLMSYIGYKDGVSLNTDSLYGLYIEDNIHLLPIAHNKAGEDYFYLEFAKSSFNKTKNIVQLKTTFNLTDPFALDFNLIAQNRGTLNFDEIIFKSSTDIEHERLTEMRKYRNCKFIIDGHFAMGTFSESGINQLTMKGCYILSNKNTDYTVRLKRFQGSWQITRSIIADQGNSNVAVFLADALNTSNIFITDAIIMSSNHKPAIYGYHTPFFEFKKAVTIKNCSHFVSFGNDLNNSCSSFDFFRCLNNTEGYLYLFETPYLFNKPCNRLYFEIEKMVPEMSIFEDTTLLKSTYQLYIKY